MSFTVIPDIIIASGAPVDNYLLTKISDNMNDIKTRIDGGEPANLVAPSNDGEPIEE